ncbi:hypothetical protein DD238_006220 [Peronospora effusa]|uniref:Uncharacterized protein n=1 Tax=Peronospora effusa TaxID=542832 RepID=A0A3M6VAU9_9STRA|nr:hypothetical protein DD238_006220 [Peronospora effusa]RQM12685.1 hypothetical protein DD237_007056 [Peronospora effusa]
MTRKANKKVTKDGGHTQGRRKVTPWDSDRVSAGSASSLDVLLAWLTTPGNVKRWCQEKQMAMCREIITILKKNGISHRETSDIRTKIWTLEKKFISADAYLSIKGQSDAFQRGEADQEVVTEVLKLCPLYRELVPVFGGIVTQRMVTDAATGVTSTTASAGDKSNETISVGPAARGGSKSVAGKWKESVEKDAAIDAVHEIACDAVENERRGDVAVVKNKVKESEKERRQGNTHLTVSRRLKATQQRNECEESSSEEVDIEEKMRVREKEEQDDDDDDDGREEQIQLAQPDDTAEGDENQEEIAELIEVDEYEEEEIAELIQVDEEDNEEVEVDDKDKNDVEEMGEIEEEEAEEEPELGGAKTEKLESSFSESENEGGDDEEEVPPTQLKAASDLEEKSDHDLKCDEGEDDDADLEEDAYPFANSRQSSRKRSSSDDSFSLRTNKRAKENSNATRALEREAFIERAKQERDQRDELFQLERAKLACELQAKQVQLAMEKALARKKLLGAGIDPAEVDRILPL